jgi:hypothetical protein
MDRPQDRREDPPPKGPESACSVPPEGAEGCRPGFRWDWSMGPRWRLLLVLGDEVRQLILALRERVRQGRRHRVWPVYSMILPVLAKDREEALRILRDPKQRFDAVAIHLEAAGRGRYGRLRGPTFAKRYIRVIRPDLPLIFLHENRWAPQKVQRQVREFGRAELSPRLLWYTGMKEAMSRVCD